MHASVREVDVLISEVFVTGWPGGDVHPLPAEMWLLLCPGHCQAHAATRLNRNPDDAWLLAPPCRDWDWSTAARWSSKAVAPFWWHRAQAASPLRCWSSLPMLAAQCLQSHWIPAVLLRCLPSLSGPIANYHLLSILRMLREFLVLQCWRISPLSSSTQSPMSRYAVLVGSSTVVPAQQWHRTRLRCWSRWQPDWLDLCFCLYRRLAPRLPSSRPHFRWFLGSCFPQHQPSGARADRHTMRPAMQHSMQTPPPVTQSGFLPRLCSMGLLQELAWQQPMWRVLRHLA